MFIEVSLALSGDERNSRCGFEESSDEKGGVFLPESRERKFLRGPIQGSSRNCSQLAFGTGNKLDQNTTKASDRSKHQTGSPRPSANPLIRPKACLESSFDQILASHDEHYVYPLKASIETCRGAVQSEQEKAYFAIILSSHSQEDQELRRKAAKDVLLDGSLSEGEAERSTVSIDTNIRLSPILKRNQLFMNYVRSKVENKPAFCLKPRPANCAQLS